VGGLGFQQQPVQCDSRPLCDLRQCILTVERSGRAFGRRAGGNRRCRRRNAAVADRGLSMLLCRKAVMSRGRSVAREFGGPPSFRVRLKVPECAMTPLPDDRAGVSAFPPLRSARRGDGRSALFPGPTPSSFHSSRPTTPITPLVRSTMRVSTHACERRSTAHVSVTTPSGTDTSTRDRRSWRPYGIYLLTW
jgi:hypothetical protein